MKRLRIAAAALLLRLLATSNALAEDRPPPRPLPLPPAEPAPNTPAPDSSGGRTADTAVYVEGGGPSGFYSVSFDRRFHDFAGRLGFGCIYVSSGAGTPSARSTTLLSVPVTISYLGAGSHTNMLELGVGVSLWVDRHAFASVDPSDSSDTRFLVPPSVFVGYRRQPADGGFVLRTGLSLLVIPSLVTDRYIRFPVLPLPYLALGAAFE